MSFPLTPLSAFLFFSTMTSTKQEPPVCLGSWHAGQGAMAHLGIHWAAFSYKPIVGMKCKADRNNFALWCPTGLRCLPPPRHKLHKTLSCLSADVRGCSRCQTVMFVGSTQYPSYLSWIACPSHTPSAVFHRPMQVAQTPLDITIHGYSIETAGILPSSYIRKTWETLQNPF